ncbi:MAG: O-antigen ligase family protein, partial [Paludibacteraceae bacterium]|nr:O-antigen ligase family protein [Paludibacteraceae bacterium]
MSSLRTYLQSLRTDNALFNIMFIILMLTVALLPFTTWFMWPIAVLLVILWAAQGDWRGKWADFKANDGIPYGLFLFGICLIPITGLFYSDNMGYAWRTVECYLWFFIAPLILLTTSRKLLTKNHIQFLLAVFCASVLLHILVLFAHGIFLTLKTGDSTYLYYSTFSFLRHPTYVALYTTFAYLVILVYLIDNHNSIKLGRKIFLYLVEAVLLTGVFCLYSRAGIITLVAVHLPIAVYAVHKRKAEWKWMLLVFIVIAVLFTLLMTTDIMPINRFTEPKYTLEKESEPAKTSDVRLILWQAGWEAAVENLPFGTGTGDCFDAMREKYRSHGYWVNFEHNYNAHNQYLQALLTNGIPGIILLLLYYFVPVAESVRRRDIL